MHNFHNIFLDKGFIHPNGVVPIREFNTSICFVLRILCMVIIISTFAVYGGIEPPSPDRQSGIVAVGPIDHFFFVGRGGLEPPLPDFQSGALTIFATSPIIIFQLSFIVYFIFFFAKIRKFFLISKFLEIN